MERYKLNEVFDAQYLLINDVRDKLENSSLSGMIMGLESSEDFNEVTAFICSCIYGYFYDDLIVYQGEDEQEVEQTFLNRLSYDIAVKLPYWYKKYGYIKKLLTTEDLSLLQTSKMTSSSSEETKTASGTLQKTATTPTGVSADGSTDSFEIGATTTSGVTTTSVETNGFADKYTNAQQKFANAGKVEGERSGTILREGSIEELLKVLEKLPASFSDEVTKHLQKHFIFDYEGEMKGIYDEQ